MLPRYRYKPKVEAIEEAVEEALRAARDAGIRATRHPQHGAVEYAGEAWSRVMGLARRQERSGCARAALPSGTAADPPDNQPLPAAPAMGRLARVRRAERGTPNT